MVIDLAQWFIFDFHLEKMQQMNCFSILLSMVDSNKLSIMHSLARTVLISKDSLSDMNDVLDSSVGNCDPSNRLKLMKSLIDWENITKLSNGKKVIPAWNEIFCANQFNKYKMLFFILLSSIFFLIKNKNRYIYRTSLYLWVR